MEGIVRKSHLISCLFVAFCVLLALVARIGTSADRTTAKPATKPSIPTEVREFEVRVDNTLRGSHRLTIRSEGTDQQAGIQTDVKVDVIVYKYVFKSRGTEVWREGK